MIDLTNIVFDSVEMADFWSDNTFRSHRLTAKDIAEMPDDTKDLDQLKIRLYDLFYEKLGRSYTKLETQCDIKTDTFQKIVRLKKGRNVTYQILAKFCIGANLSKEEAIELFSLLGHHLNEKNRCDYILLHELCNRGTLEDYDADMIHFGYGSVLSQLD